MSTYTHTDLDYIYDALNSLSDARRMTAAEIEEIPEIREILGTLDMIRAGIFGNTATQVIIHSNGGIEIYTESIGTSSCVSQSRIDELETGLYKDVDNPTNDICSICICDMEGGDTYRKLPCGHVFHKDCIDPYLVDNSSKCPNCRHDVN